MSTLLLSYSLSPEVSLEVYQGDLTLEKVDAIVNAANAYLMHGGGIAGAIVRRGGEVIQEESDAWVKKFGLVTHERPAYTQAGSLPCRYVIHAVGPIWGEGEEDQKLLAAVRGALRCSSELSIRSIALPAISTGIFHFPKEHAADLIFNAIEDFFDNNPDSSIQNVRLILLDDETRDVFLSIARSRFNL